ncbi:MAG: hypothetical protein A2W31_04435 [Planctomycetes bacterium RBG_16_64_10]|nr:MAG: hypothetical protein A2W31_04435 [Planctomycetes bacterium RBG_16_64_10]
MNTFQDTPSGHLWPPPPPTRPVEPSECEPGSLVDQLSAIAYFVLHTDRTDPPTARWARSRWLCIPHASKPGKSFPSVSRPAGGAILESSSFFEVRVP